MDCSSNRHSKALYVTKWLQLPVYVWTHVPIHVCVINLLTTLCSDHCRNKLLIRTTELLKGPTGSDNKYQRVDFSLPVFQLKEQNPTSTSSMTPLRCCNKGAICRQATLLGGAQCEPHLPLRLHSLQQQLSCRCVVILSGGTAKLDPDLARLSGVAWCWRRRYTSPSICCYNHSGRWSPSWMSSTLIMTVASGPQMSPSPPHWPSSEDIYLTLLLKSYPSLTKFVVSMSSSSSLLPMLTCELWARSLQGDLMYKRILDSRYLGR